MTLNIFAFIADSWKALISLYFDPSLLQTPEMMVRLGLQALFVIGAAFFSSSKTALFSLSRLDLQKLRRDRHPRSDTLHALLDQPRRLIAPLQSLIRQIFDRITSLIVGEEKTPDNILHIDEFRSLVEEVAREGQLDATERALIHHQ